MSLFIKSAQAVTTGQSITKGSLLRWLDPFMDEKLLLRVGWRVQRGPLKGGGTSTGSQAPSNFAQFSMEFRALERPIRRISVVSHPEANGRFPESRDMKDFCWNHHGFVPLTSVCFSSPRLEREPSPMVSSPNGRVFKTDGEEENQS